MWSMTCWMQLNQASRLFKVRLVICRIKNNEWIPQKEARRIWKKQIQLNLEGKEAIRAKKWIIEDEEIDKW